MIQVKTDGACERNPGPCAWGVWVRLEDGTEISFGGRLGLGTNNIAEWHAMREGLRYLARIPKVEAVVQSDSQVVVRRLDGSWRKGPGAHHLIPFCRDSRALLAMLPRVRVEWVPRERNVEADRAAAEALRG